MTKRISELPAAGGVADADEFELNQAGVSRKATRGQIVAGLASAAHQHDLADVGDAGALAALDAVGTEVIEPAAYASQAEAVAGSDNAKLMTALRTAEAIAAQAAAPAHQHDLADISDAGALAALDGIRPTEIDPSAYATQVDAAEGLDGTRLMTALRTAEAIAAQAAPHDHQHDLADIADAGTLAALDAVGTGEIAAAAYASQSEAVAGTDNSKIMTVLRTAEAIAAQPAGPAHQHELADITDAGALAALDHVGTAEIDAAAYASQSDAVAGSDETRVMTALRTAEAIAAQAAPPGHQHELADIADAGALAALDSVGTAVSAPAAYASQSEAVAGTDNSKIMTALRTAEAIAAQPAGPAHQHELADITDAGALAALDSVGTAEINAAAYASQSDAVAGTDNAKVMTALRTAEAIAAQAVAPEHQHDLADITDAGALAALDGIRPTEIDPSTYATQTDAAEGIDGTRLMTALRTAEAIAAQAAPHDHQHTLADVTDAGALAGLNQVGTADIAAGAYAAQAEAVAGTDNTKIMTPLRTAEAIAARAAPQGHQHALADMVDAGALAALDAVGTAEIDANAVTSDKIASGAVTAAVLADGAVTEAKISVDAVGPDQLQDTSVSPGSYTNANVTIDQQGRITAASSGSPDGEANTASNVGANGIGVFEAKVGVDLQFRNLAPASSKISVVLSGTDIELDVVETDLALPAANVTGLAAVATAGTLASLSDLDADGRPFTNYVAAQDSVAGPHVFAQSDSGREKIFTGSMAAAWTVPALAAGTHTVVHNMGTADVTFLTDGVSLKGSTTLAMDRTAALSWLPGNIVKLTGELA